MRLVIARCTIDHVGHLTAHLPSARPLLLFRGEESVSVHADDRAYKPLNRMSPPCKMSEQTGGEAPVWVVENKAREQLRITVEDIDHDSSHEPFDVNQSPCRWDPTPSDARHDQSRSPTSTVPVPEMSMWQRSERSHAIGISGAGSSKGQRADGRTAVLAKSARAITGHRNRVSTHL